MSCYLHQVPGRIRIKTSILKGRPDLTQEVEQKLGVLSGICSVAVSPVTGSILIKYNEDEVKSAAILCLVEKQCGLNLSAADRGEYAGEKRPEEKYKIVEKRGKAVLGMIMEEIFDGSTLKLLSAII